MNATIDALLADAVRRLANASDSPSLDAELLLCHALGRDRGYLRAHPESAPSLDELQAFEKLIAGRAGGEPIAYLTSKREFWSLPLKVTPATLIPRPETERLVELALERIPIDAGFCVLDLGTGSGAVALAIAHERPRIHVTATDKSAEALQVARENAASLGITNVEFMEGDWFAALGGRRFQVIVSNPPYVTEADTHLRHGDVRFEPRTALVAGPDGLDSLRRIIQAAPEHLETGGSLLLEHGLDQGAAVRALLQAAGYSAVETWRDLAGLERVSGARWSKRRAPG
ncbi:MAG: peptide chain release factor N(5)-glutamine methyltransferase [Bacillota bacterium]